jgi:hypothetical protein
MLNRVSIAIGWVSDIGWVEKLRLPKVVRESRNEPLPYGHFGSQTQEKDIAC